jgi:hypothetical protein
MSAFKVGHGSGSCRRGHEKLQWDRRGADDENPRSFIAGDGKKITWWQATEIIGISDRSMRRERYEQHGYDGLLDRRRGKPSPMRVPLQRAARVPLALPTVAYQIWTMDFTQDALASGRKFRPRSEMANTSSRP